MRPVTAPAPSHLLYLHGFRSSPLSSKAQRLAAWLRVNRPQLHWWCPQLPPSPREALQLLAEGTAGWPAQGSALMGSSLGGFYATVMAERTGWPAVLLNPAVDPARDLAAHIGEQAVYHAPEMRFVFDARHVEELRALRPAVLTRLERYFAVIATGDEVLDWREMNTRYAGARLHLIDGGDHALSDFEPLLPVLAAAMGLHA